MERVRVLVVDDNEADAALVRTYLGEIDHPQFEVDWVPDFESGRAAIARGEHDAYLIDYRLGAHNGVKLVQEAVDEGCDAPLLLLTGERSRAVDREAMLAGAVDYLVKDSLTPDVLERAIRYGIREKQTVRELREALDQVRQLRGIIPICMYCKKIRDDRDYWQQVDEYLERQAGASVSHGICPCCWEERVVPQLQELGCEDMEY
jgi:two-component system cell cycle sensor histidine kinase/response regulator CckA